MRLSKKKRTKGHSYMSHREEKDPAKVTGEELAVRWKETQESVVSWKPGAGEKSASRRRELCHMLL